MTVVDQEAGADVLPCAHALEHHVEAENLHVADPAAAVALDRDAHLGTIARRMELELPRLTVQLFDDVAKGSDCIIEAPSFARQIPGADARPGAPGSVWTCRSDLSKPQTRLSFGSKNNGCSS